MWKFFRHRDGQPIRDPIEDEFFSDESDQRTARHLVRESIQNSLDARENESDPAVVRFTFGRLSDDTFEFLTSDLQKHVKAPKSGLRHPPEIRGNGRFLVIEDFGTYGLTGNVHRMTDRAPDGNDPDEEDRFYYFWRNVGRNEKAEGARGTWGLGKTVFPASSRINTFFGLTCRDGDECQYLLGRAVLKCHALHDKQFDPDGYFACWQGDLPQPIDDERVVSRFKLAFNIMRSSDEPGLSIVIPHLLDEFNGDMLKEQIIEHYFYPILNGDLVVKIQVDPDSPQELVIDRNEILRISASVTMRKRDYDLAETIALAAWATSEPRRPNATVRRPSGGIWDNVKWSQGELATLRERVSDGEAFAVDLLVGVQTIDGTAPVLSRARLFGKPVNRGQRKRKSYFVRRGINIVDACKDNPNGFVFLVEVEDRNLAGLVGSAENPSHTNLTSREKLRDSYVRGSVALIEFLRLSPNGVAYAIEEDDREPDSTLLSDIFWRPKPKVEDSRSKRKVNQADDSGQTVVPDIDVPPRKPRALRISRGTSGFTVSRNPESDAALNEVVIKAAYARVALAGRQAHDFKSHDRLDFDFNEPSRSGLSLTHEGCKYEVRAANELRLSDLEMDFRFGIEGFDTSHRDLVIDATPIRPRET